MTQAFNLAQFANYLNTSGQVSGSGLQSGLATQWTTSGSNIFYSNNVGVGGNPGTNRFLINGAVGRLYLAANGTDYTIDSNDDVVRGKNIYFRYCGLGTSRARIWTDGELGFQANQGYTATLPGGDTFYPAFYGRAWVNFNGKDTPSIRASGNVSSIGDLGTGQFQLNFINAMPDDNYSLQGNSRNAPNRGLIVTFMPSVSVPLTTTAAFIQTANDLGGLEDPDICCISIFR